MHEPLPLVAAKEPVILWSAQKKSLEIVFFFSTFYIGICGLSSTEIMPAHLGCSWFCASIPRAPHLGAQSKGTARKRTATTCKNASLQSSPLCMHPYSSGKPTARATQTTQRHPSSLHVHCGTHQEALHPVSARARGCSASVCAHGSLSPKVCTTQGDIAPTGETPASGLN